MTTTNDPSSSVHSGGHSKDVTSHTRLVVWIVGGMITLVAFLLVFRAGVIVGVRQANFSFTREVHFAPPQDLDQRGIGGFLMGVGDLDSTHGAYGEIIGIQNSVITVKESGGEKDVLVSSSTTIREFQNALNLKDLSSGEDVIIVGSPTEDGDIDAELIRVVPQAQATTTVSTNS